MLATLGVLALCIFAFPPASRGIVAEFPGMPYSPSMILAGLYAATVTFFIAIWETFKLLSYIDKNKAFSDLSVNALKHIKYAAIAMTVVFSGAIPLFFWVAEADDAPGAVPIGMAFVCAPLVVAVFAAVLQKLVQNAIDIKSENDLTV